MDHVVIAVIMKTRVQQIVLKFTVSIIHISLNTHLEVLILVPVSINDDNEI